MKKNKIIFSWLDASWKTTRVDNCVNYWFEKSILTQEIDLTRWTIKKNIDIALNQWDKIQEDFIVMDRSIIDLIVYYYVNKKEDFLNEKKWIGGILKIKRLLQEFIKNNRWATFNYMKVSKKEMLKRLKTRQIDWKKLSKNDIKLLEDEEYLNNYIYFFDRIIEIFEKLNKKMWNFIKINKIDTTNLQNPWLQI